MKAAIFILSILFTSLVSSKPPTIGMSKAVEYEISELENAKSADFEYVYVCASSPAKTKEERAHTMVKVIMDLEPKYENLRFQVYLAPHQDLCQEGRLIGETYYSPKGLGWKGLSAKKWTWQILTTDFKVTNHQIKDTLTYVNNKTRFETEFGVMDYGEKLDKYVEKKIGHSPHYVTSGLWIDGFHKE